MPLATRASSNRKQPTIDSDKNITTSSAKTSVRKKTTTAEKIPTPPLRHEVQSPLVPLVAGEVIEISSDEEERPFTRSVKEKVLRVNHTPELRRRVKELETDFARVVQENLRLLKQNEDIMLQSTANKGKLYLDSDQIEDHIVCEVCSSTLWDPYILPDCGHTFCKICLRDWFEQSQLKQSSIQVYYTCPKCRKHIQSRPTEDFALKSVVRVLASATGEKSPQKALLTKGQDFWQPYFGT